MGRSKRVGRGGAAAIAIVAVTACSEATAPENEAMLALLADQAAVAAADHVDALRTPGVPGWGFPRFTARGVDDTPDCPVESGTFVCSVERRGGEAEVRITFLDAGGAIQSGYDEDTTAEVRIASSSERSMERESMSGFSMRSSDFTVSGLVGAETERIWNGASEGSSSRTSTLRGTSEMEFATTVEDLVLRHPREDDSWPVSGVLRSVVSGSFTDAEGVASVVNTDLRIEFNGTQYPDATLNGEAVELDLAARRGQMRGRHGPHGKGG